jgi:diguanylate cyclase (GGDEF)-like protein
VHAVSLLRDERGVPLFYVHQMVDQTEARRLRADLEYRATRDHLTGVSNRQQLMERLAAQLQTSDAAVSGVGVMFVDIDNLKPINDDNGHATGDDVITAVAERLLSSVRRQDMVARIGGDEFVVVLDGSNSIDAVRQVAEKCRAAVAEPVLSHGNEVTVTVSIGAVLAAATETPKQVLVRADEALYRAKDAGRNNVELG